MRPSRPAPSPRRSAPGGARLGVVVALILPSTTALAQDSVPVPFSFSLPGIMRGPEVVGRTPSDIRWSADGRWLYFEWLPPGTLWSEPLQHYRVRADRGAVPEALTDAAFDSLGPSGAPGDRSPDGRRRIVAFRGDLYLVPLGREPTRRLTSTVADESDPTFGRDGNTVYFVRDGNAFALGLNGGTETQLTDLRPGPAPEDSTPEGQRGVLADQQRELFQAVRDRLRRDSLAKVEREARRDRRVRPVYLQKRERVSDIHVAPNGRSAVVVTRIPTTRDRATAVPRYVTADGYVDHAEARTKVGDTRDERRMLMVDLGTGDHRQLRLMADSASPAGVTFAGWNPEGTAALVVAIDSAYRQRRIVRVPVAGEPAALDVHRDSAWVGGPCLTCAGWLDGGGRVWFVSEATGYAHLYTVASDGGDRRALTAGFWEVLSAELAPDRRTFYLHTNEGSPYQRHFATVPAGGGALRPVTVAPGGHDVVVSPDGTRLADVYSRANRPPELYFQALRGTGEPARLTMSPTAEWLAHSWIEPAIVEIPASDGAAVPARVYRPGDVGSAPNGAAVIFVHGAGYLHNVHRYWSSYFREYMFHHWLAAHGYVVLDVDYRGSAGYGRDWRTAVHRHMGGRDLQDQVDAARYLGEEFAVPPGRIGIYGGSYGGFITLMALFTEPEWFGAGAALRAVTDWAHYNHPYTARILNTPQSDSVAYRRSSPIYFAEGLEDPLLMAHGLEDRNVHAQDVIRLSQRLIELGKTRWELALYPVEDHGFTRPSSWTDEYRRIFELFERALRPEGRLE